jgi:DNA ligase-1
VGWAALRELPPPADEPPKLELTEVDEHLSRLRAIAGRGSQAARRAELARLFGRATELEQRFLSGLLVGELRQGALEGVMVDAVAKAAGIPAAEVRRAAMLAGDLPSIAEVALTHGRDGLARFRLTPLRPVKPMLAQTADGVAEALERVGPAAVEWKLDGARIQVHRLGAEVGSSRGTSRTSRIGSEVVEAIGSLPADSLVLDGRRSRSATTGARIRSRSR